MRPVTRGPGSEVRARGRGPGAAALAGLVFAGRVAQAAPAVRSFAPTQSPAWNAQASDGTKESSVVTVSTAEVGPARALPSMAGLNPNATYFYVALYPSYPYSNAPQAPISRSRPPPR